MWPCPVSQVLSAQGMATFKLSGLNAGDHSLAASYAPQAYYTGSSASGSLHVDPAPTTTVIGAPDITYGTAGSVTITISSAAGTPTGDVALAVNGADVLTHALVDGAWTFTVTGLDAGDHTLSGSFAAQ